MMIDNPLEGIDLTNPAEDSTAMLGFVLFQQHMVNIWVYTPSRGKTELHCGICKEIVYRFKERRVRWSDIAVEANKHTTSWLYSGEWHK